MGDNELPMGRVSFEVGRPADADAQARQRSPGLLSAEVRTFTTYGAYEEPI